MAPDWLDESAAIIFENESLTASRRSQFYDYFKNGHIYTLSSYLNIDRGMTSENQSPSHLIIIKNGKQIIRKQNGKSTQLTNNTKFTYGQRIVFWDEAKGKSISSPYEEFDPILYYAQSRVFTDYLLEISENPCILADIGHYLVVGNTFKNWLSMQDYIPYVHSINELEEQFMSWVRIKAKRAMTESGV